jgi:hypothetical protein
VELSGLGKFGAIVAVLVIGIDVYSRWTGKSFGPVDLLGGSGGNVLGASTLSAQSEQAQTAAAQTASESVNTSTGVAAGSGAVQAALPAPPPPGPTVLWT